MRINSLQNNVYTQKNNTFKGYKMHPDDYKKFISTASDFEMNRVSNFCSQVINLPELLEFDKAQGTRKRAMEKLFVIMKAQNNNAEDFTVTLHGSNFHYGAIIGRNDADSDLIESVHHNLEKRYRDISLDVTAEIPDSKFIVTTAKGFRVPKRKNVQLYRASTDLCIEQPYEKMAKFKEEGGSLIDYNSFPLPSHEKVTDKIKYYFNEIIDAAVKIMDDQEKQIKQYNTTRAREEKYGWLSW